MLRPSILADNLFEGFDNFIDDIARQTKKLRSLPVVGALMKTDVTETDEAYTIEIDLPGYSKENIQVTLKDGYLNITAVNEKKTEKSEDAEKTGKYLRKERYYGKSTRSFYVGNELKQEDIKAKFENGVLILTVPKKEEPKVEDKDIINIE